MKYTFIGDIHGKVEQVERALALEGTKIFVGDFQDSFEYPPEAHAKCFDLVLDAIDTGEVEAIYGNHELSYLMPNPHMCSGFDGQRLAMIKEREDAIRAKFKPYIFITPTFLVTHAGLTKQIWDKEHLTIDSLPQWLSEGWLADKYHPVHHIGHYRGGFNSVGGIFWCDFKVEFQPIPGLTQIFGHTRGKGIRQVEQSFCIDCLDHESSFLEMEIT